MKLNPRYQDALGKFMEKYKKDKNVIGIILSGSHIHSEPDKNSDLDVFVITNNSETRERGNTWIDGIEIEYFVNPVKQIKHYFIKEFNGERASPTAHMFANSVILYKKRDTLSRLIKEAKKLISAPRTQISKMEIEFARYQIDDLRKDLEDVLIRKDWFAFELISQQILKQSLEALYKMKRRYAEKNKRLQQELKSIDSRFEKLFSEALLEKDTSSKYKRLNSLIDYTEDKILHGKRPKEWILTSKCTYNKK